MESFVTLAMKWNQKECSNIRLAGIEGKSQIDNESVPDEEADTEFLTNFSPQNSVTHVWKIKAVVFAHPGYILVKHDVHLKNRGMLRLLIPFHCEDVAVFSRANYFYLSYSYFSKVSVRS